MKIFTFDTTLRDGTQGESVSFSLEDKLLIAEKLDELGIDYIEGGWPGSNPKDKKFFERAKRLHLRRARLTAFGATRFSKNPVEKDANVAALLAAETPVVSIFGKSWDFHAYRALGVTEEENLELISGTVAYLKQHGREVVYDAEHFFDGFKANPTFALRTLEAAKSAGADVLCLCDTNGGTLPNEIAEIVHTVRERFAGTVGIHCHNDSDVAVANTLVAVQAGATHVQGCMNGYGERCGNANLVSILADLELKLNYETIGRDQLKRIGDIARFIADLANVPLRRDQPFVGRSAFAHKGGVHVSAVLKDSAMYEHVSPDAIGNKQRVLLSDLSGRGNISYKLKELGLDEEGLDDGARRELLQQLKTMEHEGYDFEAAEGTFELLVRQALLPDFVPFEIVSYEVVTRLTGAAGGKLPGNDDTETTASVTLKVNGHIHSHSASGQGPVHALDICLRQCLASVYPAITAVSLTDYKVRVLGRKVGTESKVRVLVEWTDHQRSWATVGVSNNVIDASWRALVDAMRLELIRLQSGDAAGKTTRDYSWAV